MRFRGLKNVAVLIICAAPFAMNASAQSVVPNPVADTEIRDNSSIRMRSLELERTKRDFLRTLPNESLRDAQIRFERFKADFEALQKIEQRIVRTYKTGATVDVAKIAGLAAELLKRAVRIDGALYEVPESEEPDAPASVQLNVRDLIIALDGAIGDFVTSPFFTNDKLVDQETSEKTRSALRRVIVLSEALSRATK